MKEEVFEKFANKALQYLEGTEAFLKEQLPDYFQQIVRYYAIQSWIFTVVGITLVSFGAFSAYKASTVKKTYRNYLDKECTEWNDGVGMPLIIASIILLVLGSVATAKSFPTALKATIAPKVFIVDYLRGKE